MYTVSSSWLRAVHESGLRVHKAELYYGDPNTPIYRNLKIERFSISADRRNTIRRTGTVTIVDQRFYDELVSSSPAVEPYGAEIKIYAGVKYAGGTTEYVPLGVFVVEELSWVDGDIAVDITMSDRSYLLERAHPFVPQPGWPLTTTPTNVQDFVTAIFAAIFPDVVVSIDPATGNTGLQADAAYQGSWLQVITEVLGLINADGYFDVDGVFQIKPSPYVPAELLPGGEDWEFDTGPDGNLISVRRSTSRRETYNFIHVIANMPGKLPNPLGNLVGATEYGEYDDDPNSPTYVNGPFGESTYFITLQYPASSGELYSQITELLQQVKSLSHTVDLTGLMNPALHEGDIILVRFLDGTEELHLIDSITYSEGWTSSISTRSQRVS